MHVTQLEDPLDSALDQGDVFCGVAVSVQSCHVLSLGAEGDVGGAGLCLGEADPVEVRLVGHDQHGGLGGVTEDCPPTFLLVESGVVAGGAGQQAPPQRLMGIDRGGGSAGREHSPSGS